MDKDKVLRLLTDLDDTGSIAEVHFDMRELEERAEAIAQAHEEELAHWKAAARENLDAAANIAGVLDEWHPELAQLRAQGAVMNEMLEHCSAIFRELEADGIYSEPFREKIRAVLQSAPKVLWHGRGNMKEDHWGSYVAIPRGEEFTLTFPPYLTSDNLGGQQVDVIVLEGPNALQEQSKADMPDKECTVAGKQGQNSEEEEGDESQE